MGIIARNPNAPYASGKTLDGTADLEVDVSTFYSEFNGNMTDINFASNANIAGSKLATIPSAKFLNRTITTSHMATLGYVATDATGDTMTTSSSYVDVPTLSNITVTPAAATDIIVATFTAFWNTSTNDTFRFSFDVDGSPLDDLFHTTLNIGRTSLTYTWSQAAGGTSAMVIKPIYKKTLNNGACTFSTTVGSISVTNKIFSVHLIAS